MLQMAESGIIDFSEARLLDRQWWTRLSLLMNQFEKSNARRLYELQHTQHCAGITYSAGEEVLSHHWDESMKLLNKVQKLTFPWIKDDPRTDRQKAADTMRQQYVEIFGDPNDPTVQQGIQQTIKELERK